MGHDTPKECSEKVVAVRHTSSNNCLEFTASPPSPYRIFWRKRAQVLSVHKAEGQEFPETHWKHLRFF